MGASLHLAKVVRQLSRESEHQISLIDAFAEGDSLNPLNEERVKEILRARVDSGGMVLVQQDIYPNVVTELADLVLPAAPWGEEDYTRMQGERRLRIYSKIMDPPGEAKPDWWIVSQIAKGMGFDGFDWKDSNEVFEEDAERFGVTCLRSSS